MKTLAVASAAALAIALPGTAEAQTNHGNDMSAAQEQSARDTWPADRQSAYDGWPPEVQAYFWTLTPDEQKTWWKLNDQQRSQIVVLTPEDRARAWVVISGQLAESRQPGAVYGAERGQGARDITWVSNPVVQQIAADQAVYQSGQVPICKENEFDNCMNAWAAGKRGPGVERPLDHWPGDN